MRTNVVLSDELVEKAIALGKYKTKKAAIEAGLQLLVQMKSQQKIRDFRGKLAWQGDLDEMREMR